MEQMSLGEVMRRMRGQKSQGEIAKIAADSPLGRAYGMNWLAVRTQISRIENGVIADPGVYTVAVLAWALGVSVDELLYPQSGG